MTEINRWQHREGFNETVPAGRLVIYTTGSYSDYDVKTVLVALEPLNPAALYAEYLAANPEVDTYDLPEGFLAWLVNVRKAARETWASEMWKDTYERDPPKFTAHWMP